MASKKVLFVMVEGPSDEEALSLVLTRLFNKNTLHVHVMRRDITAEQDVEPNNIISKLGNEIRRYAKKYSLRPADFSAFIHIVDTDGAFVPNDCIIEDPSFVNPIYFLGEIRVFNKQSFERRNLQKSSNISRICSCNNIWRVPYQVYYMSSNLDHVLYDKQNNDDKEKMKDAHKFSKKFSGNIPGFISFFSDSSFAVLSSYSESWDFIKKGVNSLNRYSNFGICLSELSRNNNT